MSKSSIAHMLLAMSKYGIVAPHYQVHGYGFAKPYTNKNKFLALRDYSYEMSLWTKMQWKKLATAQSFVSLLQSLFVQLTP